ncbi:MAG TPA: phasin family protein [Candidatus Omnitrophota bacterium]|nr:phasin family protein [Candidatus Omnitrophota bacterium]
MKIDGFEQFIAMGKDNAEAMVKAGNVAMKGFEELQKAWQSAAARSVEKTDAAVKAMASCKSPVEIAEIQSKLARESVETAIVETRKFAELSQSVFTAALEPLNARMSAFQALAKSAA